MFTQDAGETQMINDFGTDGCLFRVFGLGQNHAWTVGYGGLFKLDLGTVGFERPFIENGNAIIYPNPASNKVCIESENDINYISIQNIEGQQIYNEKLTGKKITVDTTHFKSGIYLLQVFFTNNSVTTYKLVIE